MNHIQRTLIVGAGPAGLAVGACLRRAGAEFLMLERGDAVGPAWRNHYDRLHLHTDRRRSGLPYLPLPESYPRYPSRLQLVRYLEDYADHFDLEPRFGQEVTSIRRGNGLWQVETRGTDYRCRSVVVATGYNREPVRPRWPGQAEFRGEILHSREYRNGTPFAGKRVLVVGCGNSGAEIALDLCEHGVQPGLVVRSPVNIVPRDVLGLPLLALSDPLDRLPAKLADVLAAPIVRWMMRGTSSRGLRRPRAGPFTQIRERDRIPVIDVGTLDAVRRGRIEVRPGIDRFTRDGVILTDGRAERFDAVVLATGFRPALNAILEDADEALDGSGIPRRSGCAPGPEGLYFCGFKVSARGMLYDISREALRIAGAITKSG